MQLEGSIRRIVTKEITLFFTSPIGYLFLGVFSAVTLFVFFWGEAFFVRNIADVRPMFEWMPVLLIFLSAALTMRMWSEEKRTGSLEFILTLPAPAWHFIAGKFLACVSLLAVALFITLPLPVSIAFIADLDWGPIMAAYFATFLLGAAYLSIGLYVSARSDNQIVSLLLTCLCGGALYLLGSSTLTDFFGNVVGESLRQLGTGSRFASITRGVIDIRDLYYYVSIIAIFLALNLYTLEKQRWATEGDHKKHNQWRLFTLLLGLNALLANVWLSYIGALRIDTTEGQIYSISKATHQYLDQIREPMLLRGYFSAKTHPLLAPLVPQLKDLLREYEIAGDGQIRTEFIDPATDPEMEEEANSKYAINPVPFQVADRYQSSVVNSYFNVLVQYGDEYQVLGFHDLIEVKADQAQAIDVRLRNPEYDITRSIKKVLYGFQSGGNLFSQLSKPVDFTAYISTDKKLPQYLATFRDVVKEVADEMQTQSKGQFKTTFLEPEKNGGAVAKQITKDYGFKPMATSLLSKNTFYFYLTLNDGEQIIQIPIPSELNKDALKRDINSGLKRFAKGFLKTVGLATPKVDYQMAQYGRGGNQFNQLRNTLSENMTVRPVDLSTGAVPYDVDILAVMDPTDFTDKQRFAVDQFLMKGGTIIFATSPFNITFSRTDLSASAKTTGLEEWFEHNGFKVDKKFVLDSQNAAFPIPVARQAGGFTFQEIRLLEYPYLVDVREEGFQKDNIMLSELPQLTMAWSSPINIDKEKNSHREMLRLLQSSPRSWLSDDTDIKPKIDHLGKSAFTPSKTLDRYLLGAAITGQFNSFYQDKEPPIYDTKDDKSPEDNDKAQKTKNEEISSVIDKSPESARIILFSSNQFLEDSTLRIMGAMGEGLYQNSLQLITNAIEWSLEDSGLLSIRTRSHFNRTLPSLEQGSQMLIEYLNYGIALIAIFLVAWLHLQWQKRRARRYISILAGGGAQ